MDSWLSVAFELAHEAGKIIKENFGKDQQVMFRADKTPITHVDYETSAMVSKRLHQAFPDHDIWTDVHKEVHSRKSRYQWICDPLDGTKAYIQGLPNNAFVLGLCDTDQMKLTVVFNPHDGTMYHAVRGKGAFCNNRPIHVSSLPLDQGSVIVGADSYAFIDSLQHKAGRVVPMPGVAIKCMMIAAGQAEGMVNDIAEVFDMAPCSLIIEEAGGNVTDLYGRSLNFSEPFYGTVASNARAHKALLEITQDALMPSPTSRS